jgi:hypothetical protein
LAFVILFVAAIRIRLLELPLERDEGEFAYAGQLLLQGVPPYQLAYNMKLPGTDAAYALIMAVFGQTTAGIHLGLVLLNAATTVLVFLLAKRLMDGIGAFVAAATFALLSASPSVLGNAAHATHFVLLPALMGFLALLRALEHKERWTLFTAGLLFGLAFLMKQPGVFFGICGGVYLVYHEVRGHSHWPWRSLAAKCALFSLGAALPFALLCLLLYLAGDFDAFWFWTFSYAWERAAMVPLEKAFQNFLFNFERVTSGGCLLWIVAGLGTIELFLRWKIWPKAMFMAGLIVFSFLAICPGFDFREHYFIVLLPAAGIAAGLVVSSAQDWLSKTKPVFCFVPVAIFAAAWGGSVFQQRALLLQLPPARVCRAMYEANPFPEAVEIARYIKAHSTKDETIAVLGSEAEIYFYADRRSATGYIYMYALTEPQPYALQMQRQMIHEIETAKPAYVVLVSVVTSWNPVSESSQLIFDWFNRYSQENLELVGVIDILSPTQTGYYWKTEGRTLPPPSDVFLEVFKRKSASGS